MHEALKSESHLSTKTFEAFIAANFMDRSHLQSTYWHCLAFSFNSLYQVCKAIELSDALLALRKFKTARINLQIVSELEVL